MASATVTIHFDGSKDIVSVKTLTVDDLWSFEYLSFGNSAGLATDKTGLRAIRDAINEHVGEE